ncbi:MULTISPECIES: glucose-1-phosphate adenylyltransferase [Sporomusa]|jgi:glucose-1-phosphate adenylyltransferase|uniref:Glucose-1-phosphate adenylyltransferase n=1 Tax=uncultured Sporomusa sp. TaxID=307249 RepID=A0A212LXA0_9FIRM|nr:glucose-1-phosphate adenylyltransferase [Sporomusa sphaeroides]MCM0761398.1 glucose-1-phosphate adenylyltransferase [Sporomusa sphaeroides DSM 2875]SCM82148.1 glucose-1-phosphate adenylyltransferase [uncultured Sporomusa sp.]
MRSKECVAMILAGGQGSRLGALTKKLAKPAVPFGGKYRIIDFPLSNCYNSGIDTVGVLTQYQPLALHSYIGIGSAWDLDRRNGGVYVLPPYVREKSGEWYKGTADAIYQNFNFIEMFNPEYVLILSGDHIYKMDYSLMLDYHKTKQADVTIAVIEVPWEEAGRFGIMNTAAEDCIVEFEEKPKNPKNNLASMGIYVFSWPALRAYLAADAADTSSSHDFGKNVIPKMLAGGERLYAYRFSGYWKDVGTVESFWEANMDLLGDEPTLNLYDPSWRIYSVSPAQPPHFVADTAQIICSMITEGCQIHGQVENSVLFPGVYVGAGARVKDSIIMPYTTIGANAVINKAIIGRKSVIEAGAQIGTDEITEQEATRWFSGITLIGDNLTITSETKIKRNALLARS